MAVPGCVKSVYSCSLTNVKVTIETERCNGHGRCYSLAPNVFDSDDDGRGRVIVGDVDDQLLAAARIAASNCPEAAITISD